MEIVFYLLHGSWLGGGRTMRQKDGIKCLMGPQAESHSGWGQDCGVRREEGFKRSQIYERSS